MVGQRISVFSDMIFAVDLPWTIKNQFVSPIVGFHIFPIYDSVFILSSDGAFVKTAEVCHTQHTAGEYTDLWLTRCGRRGSLNEVLIAA